MSPRPGSPHPGYAFPKLDYMFQKFSIYKTSSNVYIIAQTNRGNVCQLLTIPRDTGAGTGGELVLDFERKGLCSFKEHLQRLPRHDPTFKKITDAHMILGFVQFVANSFYLYVVTEKKKVGTVNGASVYAIVDTELLPITKLVTVRKRASRHVSEEAKLRSLFLQVDLTDEFYFSYYYDITNTVEANMSKGGASCPANGSTRRRRKGCPFPAPSLPPPVRAAGTAPGPTTGSPKPFE